MPHSAPLVDGLRTENTKVYLALTCLLLGCSASDAETVDSSSTGADSTTNPEPTNATGTGTTGSQLEGSSDSGGGSGTGAEAETGTGTETETETEGGDGECTLIPIDAWLSDQPMLGRRESQAVAWTEERMYALGGFENGVTDDVWFAPFGEDGEPLGEWVATTNLPHNVQHHTVHRYGDWIYLFGGDGESGTFQSVHVVPIQDDGGLGAWMQLADLDSPRTGHTSVVSEGRVFLFGGFDNFTSSVTDSVVSASLGEDGSIGAWEEHAPLGQPTAWHAMTQVGGHVYLAGGTSATGTVRSQVLVAPLGAELGKWAEVSSLPAVRFRFGLVATEDGLVSMGGADQTGTATTEVYQARRNEDGSLSGWVQAEPFPEARFAQATAWRDGRVWALGGYFESVQGETRDTVFTTTYCE